MFRNLFTVSSRILHAVSESFAPSTGSTAKQVRINGAISLAAAFGCLLIGGLVIYFAEPHYGLRLAFIPVIAAYALIIVGGYRLVYGQSAKASPYEVASFHRILFGVVWVAVIVGGPILLLIWHGT